MTDISSNYNQSKYSIKNFDVFISFCSSDRFQKRYDKTIDVVSEIKKKLENYHHPESKQRLHVCSYEEDFELDSEVSKAIFANIDRSNAVLFLSTHTAGDSKYVFSELEYTLKAKGSPLLLAGIVNQHPHNAFPTIFNSDAHGADFSFEDCNNLSTWRNRLEFEAAKIAARIWNLPLKTVRDRFLLEKRKRRSLLLGLSAVALIAIMIISAISWNEFKKRKASNILGIHQRYAADMLAVQQAWRRGEVNVVRNILNNYSNKSMEIDARSFEWYTFQQVISAEKFSFGKGANSVKSLAISPTQQLIAFSSEDKPVTIYNSSNGQLVAVLSNSTKASGSVAFSADGSMLVATSGNKIVLWNTRLKSESVVNNILPLEFVAVCATSNSTILTVDNDGNVAEIENGALKILKNQLFQVDKDFHLHFIPNLKTIAGINGNGKLQLTSIKSYRLYYENSFPDFNSQQDFAIMGDKILLSTGDHITMIDLVTKKIKTSYRLCNNFLISGVAANSQQQIIAAGDPSDHSLVFWEVINDNNDKHLALHEIGSIKGYSGWLNLVSFIPNSTKVIASSLAGDVKIWDYSKIGRSNTYKHASYIKDITYTYDNKSVISVDKFGGVKCWNAIDKKDKWNVSVSKRQGAIAFYGNYIAIADDSIIHLIDGNTGKKIDKRYGYEPIANVFDKTILAYIHPAIDAVMVESLKNGRIDTCSFLVKLDSGEEDYVSAIALSNDKRYLLAAITNGKVTCFDIVKREAIYTISAHNKYIYAIKANIDGSIFATASSDSTVAVWDTQTGKQVIVFKEHLGSVQTLAFSPDKKTLASGAQDGMIKLYNIPSKMPTISFSSHKEEDSHPGVTALAFSFDGSYLISGGGQFGTIIQWQAKKDEPQK